MYSIVGKSNNHNLSNAGPGRPARALDRAWGPASEGGADNAFLFAGGFGQLSTNMHASG